MLLTAFQANAFTLNWKCILQNTGTKVLYLIIQNHSPQIRLSCNISSGKIVVNQYNQYI